MDYYNEIKKIYDNSFLYNNEFSDYDDDFTFWTYWIKKIKPKKVLEIGIGNGRLVKLLSRLVPVYDGVDFSENIIKDFRIGNDWFKGKLFWQDMKNIHIDNVYDLIIVPFNTFSYLYTFEDLFNFFNSIKKISNKNTVIIIDIINPSILDLKSSKRFKLCNEFLLDNKLCKLYEKHYYNGMDQTVNYFKKYVIPNNENIVLNLPVRIFFHQELLNLVRLFGFDTIRVCGDYNNEIYSCDSRKQILFLKMEE